MPLVLRDNMLGKLHCDVWEVHFGEEKLMHCVQKRYYWPGYSESMTQTFGAGHVTIKCARKKSSIPQRKASMQTIQTYADHDSGYNGTSTSDR